MADKIGVEKWEQVKRAYLSGGESYASLAERFGIGKRSIEKIGSRDGWYRMKMGLPLSPKPNIDSQNSGKVFKKIKKIKKLDECIFCDFIQEQIDDVVVAQLGLPRISKFKREYQVPEGRIDFVVWHQDGSTSLLEVKYGLQNNTRLVATALGQLSCYLESYKRSKTYQGELVRPIFIFNKDIDAMYRLIMKQSNPEVHFLRPKLYL